jgi:hypothetical protein
VPYAIPEIADYVTRVGRWGGGESADVLYSVESPKPGTQTKKESPQADSPVLATAFLSATYKVGAAEFEPATP